MHFGFTIIVQQSSPGDLQDQDSEKAYFQYLSRDQSSLFYFDYCRNDRFAADKLFFENANYIAGIDGVVLNLDSLKKSYALASWEALLILLFEQHQHQLPNQLAGEFSGFIFDKKQETVFCFTNQNATKKVYYRQTDANTIIAPSLQDIVSFMQAQQQKASLHRLAAYALLTSGCMPDNATLIEGVFRLHGGEYLLINTQTSQLKKYLDYNDTVIRQRSEQSVIDELEERFQFALQLEYEKDKAYGHQHLATLSGGLDSRMNVFLAQKAGYKISNLCFSQSGYDDEIIARQIAQHLNQDITAVPLDDGKYVFDFEENMDIYEGQIFYTTSAHFNYAIKKMDLAPFGLIHSGLLGDGILGAFLSQPKTLPPTVKPKLISNTLFPKIEKEMNAIASKYVSEDVYSMYQRFFNMTISGSWAMERYAYLVSPFIYPDFIKTCMEMPPEYKFQQKIYIKWINRLHPELAQFKWESTGFKPSHTWLTAFSRYSKKAISLSYRLFGQGHKLSMTPYQYWYETNPEMPSFMDSVFEAHINLLGGDRELQADVRQLFQHGNAIEKTLAMTLLGGIRRLEIEV